MTDKEEFEKWAYPKGYVLTRNKSGFYVHYKTFGAYEAWQDRNEVIDAFIHDNSLMFARLEAIKQENAALKYAITALQDKYCDFEAENIKLKAALNKGEEHD